MESRGRSSYSPANRRKDNSEEDLKMNEPNYGDKLAAMSLIYL